MRVLVTECTGFIGSHCCVELIASGNEIVCIDNLSNPKRFIIDRVQDISNNNVVFYEHDICDEDYFVNVMVKNKCNHPLK